MPVQPLNNVTTADAYTNGTTLVAHQQCVLLNIDVSNAAVFLSIATADGATGAVTWQPERYFTPASKSIPRRCIGARVRSAVPGKPAQVTLELVERGDLP